MCKSKKKRVSNHSPATTNLVQNALLELLETEKSYGGDLKYLVANFLDPIRSEALFFDHTDLMGLNSVTLDLAQVQTKFQHRLERAVEGLASPDVNIPDLTCKVSDAFLDSDKDFEIYNKYILCMSRVQKVVSKTTGIEEIVKFVEERFQAISQTVTAEKEDPEILQRQKIMTMESLIMKPFQRIMLYPLILERIHNHCEAGTVDEEKIRAAIQMIKHVGTQMNEALKQDETSNSEYDQMLKGYGIPG